MSTISLKPSWIKLTIKNKYIFYNYKEDIITYHPPFPLSQIDQFLKYYHYEINRQELLSQLGAKANEKKYTSNQDNISKKKKIIDINLEPITNETILQDCVSICKKESLEKMITFIFNNKYTLNPSYQYKKSGDNYQCQIKVKDKELLLGEEKETKSLSKREVELALLKKLIPSIYDEVVLIDNTKKEERRIRHLINYRKQFEHDKSQELSPPVDIIPRSESFKNNINMNNIINNIPEKTLLSSSFNTKPSELISHNTPKEDDIEMIDLISNSSEYSPDIDDPSIIDIYKDKKEYLPFKLLSNLVKLFPQLEIKNTATINRGMYKVTVSSLPLRIEGEGEGINKMKAVHLACQSFFKSLFANEGVTKYDELCKYFNEGKFSFIEQLLNK